MSKSKEFLLGLAIVGGLTLAANAAMAKKDGEPPRPPACEDDVELVALVYSVDNPARSMALVGAEKPSLVRIGSWLGDRQVIAMGPRTLVLGPTDNPCSARLTERSTRQKTPTRRRKRNRRRRSRRR